MRVLLFGILFCGLIEAIQGRYHVSNHTKQNVSNIHLTSPSRDDVVVTNSTTPHNSTLDNDDQPKDVFPDPRESEQQLQQYFNDIIKFGEEGDYYKVLDIPRNATVIDMKNARKNFFKKYHPDKMKSKKLSITGIHDAGVAVNKAYDVLTSKPSPLTWLNIYDLFCGSLSIIALFFVMFGKEDDIGVALVVALAMARLLEFNQHVERGVETRDEFFKPRQSSHQSTTSSSDTGGTGKFIRRMILPYLL